MTERRLRIAIDMDDVIADTIEKFVTLYKKNHGFDLRPVLKDGVEIREALPVELKPTLPKYINAKGFFRDIVVMKDSPEVLKALTGRYDVYIVSAAMEFKNSLIDKFDWLEEHFPFIPWTNIIFCGHKIVKTDIIIDDRIRNFTDFDGRKLLYSSPHNMLLDGYERVNSWNEVAGKLL
jgi:5'(3')-deoxyribonucleotidase